MRTKELIVTVTEQIVCPVAYHLQKSILTNDRGERVPLIKMLVIWGNSGLNIPQKQPPKILLSHESF